MSEKFSVLQDDLKDCGVCCLLSIVKYYHGDVPRTYLRELTKTSKNGVSAFNLLRAARELGFEAYGYQCKLKDLKKVQLPLIAHIIVDKKMGHFVVIYQIDYQRNDILVMDPSKGYVHYSFTKFQNVSSNNYLIFKPKQLIPKIENDDSNYWKISKIIMNKKNVLIVVFLLSLFYTFLNIVSSYHLKLLYDEKNVIEKIFFFLLFLEIFKCLFNVFRNYLITQINYFVDKTLIQDAFQHIIHLPYLYYKNHTNGDLLTRINDLGNVKMLISQFFISIFVDLLLGILVIIFLFKINVSLTIITIISLIIYSLITILSNKKIKNKVQESYAKTSYVNNYLMEALASFETIKNLSIENYIQKRFNHEYQSFSQINKKLFEVINWQNMFKEMILAGNSLLVLYLGIVKINHGLFSMTLLITFITLVNYLIVPVKNILDLQLTYLNTKESLRRIKELFQIPKEENVFRKEKSIKDLKGNIDIMNVSYSYNGKEKALKNLSLNIKEGEKVLIYGSSGSGKSTLMQLFIKYLDNNYDGNINIGGFDLKKLDIFTLRKNICYVSQNEYLYTDTIYNNITLGNRIKYQDFLKLTKNTFVDEIVNKSLLGFNYLVENNGENISGGEKSRLLIARSLIRKANIYIYDETFSPIDIAKERMILSYMFDLLKDKTILVISHRLSNEDLYQQKIKVGD